MEIKACIFDLDGVIVDTARFHYLAWKSIARDLNFEFSPEHNERLKGVSRMRSLEILLEVGGLTFNEESKAILADKKNKLYLDYILQLSPEDILPGVREFLEELRAKGIRTALGSASKNALTIMNRLEIASLFDAIIDGNKVSTAKPDPEVFLKGAAELGIHPDQCIVFEDAEAGVEAALAAGMKCVGVGSPLILGKAHVVISGFAGISFKQIRQMIEKDS